MLNCQKKKKKNLQAEMEAQEELQKGEVGKASSELVQELMFSKQKKMKKMIVLMVFIYQILL